MMPHFGHTNKVCSVHYTRLFAIAQAQMGPKSASVIRNSGVSLLGDLNVLKSMEIQSGHLELSVISQVSTGPLNGVPM